MLLLYLFLPAGCVVLMKLTFASSGDATLNFFAIAFVTVCVGVLSWRRKVLTRPQLFARATLTSSGILLPAAFQPSLNVPAYVGALLLGPVVLFGTSLLIGTMLAKLRRGAPGQVA